jgi:protein-tyrosine kinase
MSLVEQALKKMQAATTKPVASLSSAAAPEAASPIGRGVLSAAAEPPAQAPRERNTRVVALNVAAFRAAGLLPPEHQARVISQQFRQIKRPLIASALGHGAPALPQGNLIMVASALPGEGKTFTSINLALSLAKEKDVEVLLIDADVAKPHISRMFGLADEDGLLDAVRDPDIDVEDLVVRTDQPSLSVLPAGRRSENATELFSSARMESIARQLSGPGKHRLIVLDSPPLMLTTESQALAQVAGQVVLVVRADVTGQQVVMDALRCLGDRPTSLILNQSTSAAARGEYYYHGYGDHADGGALPG